MLTNLERACEHGCNGCDECTDYEKDETECEHSKGDDVEARVQGLLSRRRAMNVSGQNGEDIKHIRAAFTATSSAGS